MGAGEGLTAAPAAPLVLAILGEGERHGYAIVRDLRARSGGRLRWGDDLLYPLLHRLRRLGYVTARWQETPAGARRVYALTDLGRAALAIGAAPAVRRAPRRGRLRFAVPAAT